MRPDNNEVISKYSSIYPKLQEISSKLEEELKDRVKGEVYIDKVTCRCKSLDSFVTKANKLKDDGNLKYNSPFQEIQDKIGARIVVFYKTNVDQVKKLVSTYFRHIEEKAIIPDDVSKFGYEGFHMICKIPNTVYSLKNETLIGDFFELQIKTLYQHAWSQTNHGLGYKPDQKLGDDEVRLLAFIAAQSWGADKGLSDLATSSNTQNRHHDKSLKAWQ